MVRLWEPSRTGEASLQNLTFAVKIVRYCGLWRSEGDTKLYMSYTFVVTMTFILAYFKILYFCFSANADMSLFIETLSMVFGLTPTLVATYLILAFSGNFTEIVERIRALISYVNSDEEHWKYVVKDHSTVGKKRLTKYYLASGQVTWIIYMLKPLLTKIFWHVPDLPVKQLGMSDNNDTYDFFVQYFAQIFICACLWVSMMSLDILCFNIIVSCAHQLKILSYLTVNIASTASGESQFSREITRIESVFVQGPQSPEYVNTFSNNTEKVINLPNYSLAALPRKLVYEELRNIENTIAKLSDCHQETLKTAGKMIKLLNPVMLTHYFFTSINLCLLTYNVQNSKDQSQLISTSSRLVLVFFRIAILGWISSELSSESLLVADGAYFCNWYDLSLSAKKTLIIMMARAQRPVIIKAGPIGSLSLETCKKLLEAAYSYLNVLNNMA